MLKKCTSKLRLDRRSESSWYKPKPRGRSTVKASDLDEGQTVENILVTTDAWGPVLKGMVPVAPMVPFAQCGAHVGSDNLRHDIRPLNPRPY